MAMNENLGKRFEFKATPVFEKFYNEDSMWGAYAVEVDRELPETSWSDKDVFGGIGEQIYKTTIIGKTQRMVLGNEYDVIATLVFSNKHNTYSYEIISVSTKVPKSREEQSIFLQSVLTELQANTILDVYPNIVNDVVEGNDDVNLSLLKGIGEVRWAEIKSKILENFIMSDLLVLLAPLGVTITTIKNIFKHETNPQVMKELLIKNPYVLTDVRGISFNKADTIALSLSPELVDSRFRLVSFINYYLEQSGDDLGHTWVKLSLLKHEVKANIPQCFDEFKLLVEEERENPEMFYIEDDKFGKAYHRFVEEDIYRIVKEFNDSEPIDISDEEIEEGIRSAEEKQGFLFTDEQRDILKRMTESNFNMITGKAGTGKTTLLRGIMNIYQNHEIFPCALSAKASKRIKEATGFEASTIHRLLGAKGDDMFSFDKRNPLPYGLIVVDEASMVNAYIFHKLLSAVREGSKVILCGDAKQLPPIGFGNIFSDLLEKDNEFQVNSLTKILRQAEKSGIIKDANKIREGVSPIKDFQSKIVHGENRDMFYMFRDNKSRMRRIAINMFLKSVEQVGVDNVFILTPRKDTVTNSSLEINKKIQDILLDDEFLDSIESGNRTFKVGCKVIHRVNNYDKQIFNGEIGYLRSVKRNSTGTPIGAVVEYEDNKFIEYTKKELSEIDFAYALTTHLFQGSEAHTIIGVIDKSHYIMLDTTFLYTMITRAKERCLLIAEPYAFDRCLKNNKSIERQTWLKEL